MFLFRIYDFISAPASSFKFITVLMTSVVLSDLLQKWFLLEKKDTKLLNK